MTGGSGSLGVVMALRWHNGRQVAGDGRSGSVDLSAIGFAVFGAIVGALGSILAGLLLQRREGEARSRAAARAVWFEIGINAVAIDVARDHEVFSALSRSSFDRLLPDLATWLPLDDLQLIALAYQGHAGYEQAWRDTTIPQPVRHQVPSASRKPRGRPTTAWGCARSDPSLLRDAAGPERTTAR